MLKQNILKSIDLITKCMHQDHLQKDFNFSYKPQILNQIIVIPLNLEKNLQKINFNLICFKKTYINSETSKVITNDIKSMLYKICSNIM